MKTTQSMTVSVDAKTLKQIDQYCKDNGMISRSAAVRMAVQFFLANQGKRK